MGTTHKTLCFCCHPCTASEAITANTEASFKGIVHPKTIFHLCPAHHFVALVSLSNPCSRSGVSWTKEFYPPNADSSHIVQRKEATIEKHNMLPCCSCGAIQVPRRHSTPVLNHVFIQNIYCSLLDRNVSSLQYTYVLLEVCCESDSKLQWAVSCLSKVISQRHSK